MTIEDPDTTVDPPVLEDEATIECASPLETDAEALVAAGRPVVDAIARRLVTQLGGAIELEELRSVGLEALAHAVRTYDPARAPFTPYLTHKLRWAMLDHARREPHARARRGGVALAVAELTAGDEEPSARGRDALATALAARAGALFVGLRVAEAREEPAADSSADPERALGRAERARRLRAAVAALPDRQRDLVERHWFGGERFDHIAESLGLSKSWASRLHAQAIAQLATVLADD